MPSAPAKIQTGAKYRWAVASRAIAAIVGGYIFTVSASVLLSALAPSLFGMSKPFAVHAGLVSTFLFYLFIIMWVFAAKSATRAWVVLLSLSALFGVLSYLLDVRAV